jgi:GTPase SAR1 family protein
MICFDISCIETFEHVPKWLEELRSKSENVCIFLVGTKKDKVHLREVEQRQALRFCELNDLAGYVETSAKENSNIDLVFESLVAERFKADHQTISLDKVDNIAQPRVPSFSTKGVVDLKGVLIPTEGEELRTRNGCAC